MRKIKIIFTEIQSKNKVNIENITKYFPEADIECFYDKDCEPVFDKSHPRYGWRMHDYYQLRRLCSSNADITIAFDADMLIKSLDVRSIIQLTRSFGLCLPCNNRHLVRVDTKIGADSDKSLDETHGTAYAFNTAIIALDGKCPIAKKVLHDAAEMMLKHPVRLPLTLWRSAHKNRFFPCLLPPQWCVCDGDEGCGNEIILHIGHEKVRKHYGITTS